MDKVVILNLPETVAKRAHQVASETQRQVEDVLVEWLNRASVEPPIESLPDAEVLALCAIELSEPQQVELDDLLFDQRESQLSDSKRERLDALMDVYRRGMVRKAQALRVAVERGLRPPLN